MLALLTEALAKAELCSHEALAKAGLCSHEELKHRGNTEERQRITVFLMNLHAEMAEIECNEILLCDLISHFKVTSNSVKLCVKNFGNLSVYLVAFCS
jgi:hypothetical protein